MRPITVLVWTAGIFVAILRALRRLSDNILFGSSEKTDKDEIFWYAREENN
ncbi:MAG: hypothetical protein ABH879_01905 [archaeon]